MTETLDREKVYVRCLEPKCRWERVTDLDGYWEAITECGIHLHEEHDNA